MILTINIFDGAATVVPQVAKRCVQLVRGLLAGPVQRLTGIVLYVARDRYIGYSEECVGEVLHQERPQREGLAIFVLGWEAHRNLHPIKMRSRPRFGSLVPALDMCP
jgi:hypothetical protein